VGVEDHDAVAPVRQGVELGHGESPECGGNPSETGAAADELIVYKVQGLDPEVGVIGVYQQGNTPALYLVNDYTSRQLPAWLDAALKG
jgi:hypothetical protein